MRNFRELEVYQQSMNLCTDLYKLIESMPPSEKYGLRSQLTRCTISIPSNIAEGASRRTSQDFARFLLIAIGSSFELETQLIIAKNVKLLDSNEIDNFLQNLTVVQKRLNALRIAILN